MLSNQFLSTIKPPPKLKRYHDTGKSGVSGLYAEVTPTLKITFRLKYRFDGKEKTFTIGKYPEITLAEARLRCADPKRQLADGMDPNEIRKQEVAEKEREKDCVKLTFQRVVEIYLEKESVNHKGHKWNKDRLNKLIREFADLCSKPIDKVDPLDLIEWRDYRLEEVSAASVNREANILSSVFTYAVVELRVIADNPMSKVKRPKKSNPRHRRVSQEEIDIICTACNYERGTTPTTKTAMAAWCFLFAIESAMRASEITGMRWENVYDDFVHIPDTKNGTSRDVALLGSAVELIKLMRGVDENRVVPMSAGSVSSTFREVRNGTYLKDADLRFHDSRHEACTRLAQILPIQDLAKVSGHKDLKILLNVYYNITASEIAIKMRQGQQMQQNMKEGQPMSWPKVGK
jgi:integrase